MGNRRTAERPARHLNAGSWLVLAIAIGYLVAGVIYTLLAFQQPTDGWYYNADDGVTVEFSQGGAGPLQPGDRVIAVAGRSLDEDSDLVRRGPPPDWQLGATVPYTVVRDGTAIELEVPLMRRQPSALLRSLLAGSVIGNFAALFCLVLGFVVFLLRPRDTAARLLLLILIYYELLRVIHETIQPEFAGLWLREPGIDKVTK